MDTFGRQLRFYRKQSRDPDRGGQLTQARLGELIGLELGDTGYAGAAVSYWEQDKYKISEDDRLVLVSLIKVLHKGGGLTEQTEANELLRAGNYRDLNEKESSTIFYKAVSGTPGEQHLSTRARSESSPTIEPALERGERQDVLDKTIAPKTPESDSQRRQQQLILLNKVDRFWVEGVLDHSISDVALIDLGLRSQSDAIEQPWAGIVDSTVFDDLELSKATSIGTVFENNDRALLILGNPGAGKTTVLLLLARDLIARVREDSRQPIPVVLNLVSWEATQNPLADWIVNELTAKYQIPRQIGRKWLDDDQLILLLDGFDEVRDRCRTACAEEINRFRETRGLTGIVVCSRRERYEASSVKMSLGGAMVIDPLTPTQVDNYLEAAGSRLSALRGTIQKDGSMRDMARSPLMLSVMGVTYSDSLEIRVAEEDISEVNIQGREKAPDVRGLDLGRRDRLFEAYVQRMFDRYGGDPAFPRARTEKYLGWLARMLSQHNMSVFLIEQMQPSWLPSIRWRRAYILTHGLIVGLVCGIILSLFLELVDLPTSEFASRRTRTVSSGSGLSLLGS